MGKHSPEQDPNDPTTADIVYMSVFTGLAVTAVSAESQHVWSPYILGAIGGIVLGGSLFFDKYKS